MLSSSQKNFLGETFVTSTVHAPDLVATCVLAGKAGEGGGERKERKREREESRGASVCQVARSADASQGPGSQFRSLAHSRERGMMCVCVQVESWFEPTTEGERAGTTTVSIVLSKGLLDDPESTLALLDLRSLSGLLLPLGTEDLRAARARGKTSAGGRSGREGEGVPAGGWVNAPSGFRAERT